MTKDTTLLLNSGNIMPVFGLGTWQLTKDTAETIAYAISLGHPLIDTSSDYGTQPGIGNGLRKSGVPRDKVYIVTKVEETDDAYQRTKANLEELDIDYVDLTLIHRPPPQGAGETLWKDLIRAREEGLTKDIGVSNYSIDLIDKLIANSGDIPAVNQIEWSPFGHSDEMLKYCNAKRIVIQAYSPLTRTKRLDDKTLKELAEKYGVTSAQILLRWNLQMGTVPIPKANQKRHLDENINVFDFELESKDMEKLSNLNEEYSSLGSLPYVEPPHLASNIFR
ncbi:aldo/keto reductase [Candidatus Curtissbacteria bacterium]|nr:aldo/keto reductase [Candidatus Curtissbacteria bacterium]